MKVMLWAAPWVLLLGWFENQPEKKYVDAQPVVVVELFTSQGCSSCPAADQLLSRLKSSGQSKVIPLSFHVAYWNYLGWEDPFSDERFSKRQRNYARYLRSSVYTPQMIFNGARECVGSSKSKVDYNVEQSLRVKPSHQVDLKLHRDGRKVDIKYDIKGSLQNRSLQVALVESMISVEVKRGENRGRTLQHDNVVRHFKTIPLHRGPQGSYSLQIPADFNIAEGSIVAYIQHNSNLSISGASQSSL